MNATNTVMPLVHEPLTAALEWTLLTGIGVLYALASATKALPCRALLTTVARDKCTVIRRLWRGTPTSIGLIFLSLTVSALLLSALGRLSQPVRDAYQRLILPTWSVMGVNVGRLTPTRVVSRPE